MDSARTGTPDATNGIKIPTVLMQEDSSFEAPGGIALSDRIAAGPSAQRSGLSSDDTATTDMSTVGFAGTSGANLEAINNRGALVVWCEFANSAGSAVVRVVYYDSSNNPLFVGPALPFSALAQRVSASGDYMSEPQIVESYGASKYRCFLQAKGTGNVDIFAHPL
jgi:hypothetical protein